MSCQIFNPPFSELRESTRCRDCGKTEAEHPSPFEVVEPAGTLAVHDPLTPPKPTDPALAAIWEDVYGTGESDLAYFLRRGRELGVLKDDPTSIKTKQ